MLKRVRILLFALHLTCFNIKKLGSRVYLLSCGCYTHLLNLWLLFRKFKRRWRNAPCAALELTKSLTLVESPWHEL